MTKALWGCYVHLQSLSSARYTCIQVFEFCLQLIIDQIEGFPYSGIQRVEAGIYLVGKVHLHLEQHKDSASLISQFLR